MNLQYRVELLERLGDHILSRGKGWETACERASHENGWFISPFIEAATDHIARAFLRKEPLTEWIDNYEILDSTRPATIGIVMAGNIPLVGFHDLLCSFISGNRSRIKASTKDKVLIKHLANTLISFEKEVEKSIEFSELLRGCDAYIATGSNNSSRYFDYYFAKYPHIIRRNKTSVAVLTGKESTDDLEKLADDVFLYFGLGCRNVTKLFVPVNYDFIPLLKALGKYEWMVDIHKYRNNYDYQLALLVLNKKYYMSNAALLLVEDPSPFSPISQLHYEFYENRQKLITVLQTEPHIQALVGDGFLPFGKAQYPLISDYADGVDTLKFLVNTEKDLLFERKS